MSIPDQRLSLIDIGPSTSGIPESMISTVEVAELGVLVSNSCAVNNSGSIPASNRAGQVVGVLRAGLYDPGSNTLNLGGGGHFPVPGVNNPSVSIHCGITTLETTHIVVWANDSRSFPKALDANSVAEIQSGLRNAFPGKQILKVDSLGAWVRQQPWW